MGEEGPEPASQHPEGEDCEQGRLKHIGEQRDCSTCNNCWVQALMDGEMIMEICHSLEVF